MAEKTSGVAAEFERLNPKILYTHCPGHVLNLAVKEACFKVNIPKVTFEMTREICKLVKESRQRNNRLEEIKKTTKNQAESVEGFCPTRWTVRGKTLDSIINNYDQLMSLWKWSSPGCLCDNWKPSFLSLFILNWCIFPRRVTARW